MGVTNTFADMSHFVLLDGTSRTANIAQQNIYVYYKRINVKHDLIRNQILRDS